MTPAATDFSFRSEPSSLPHRSPSLVLSSCGAQTLLAAYKYIGARAVGSWDVVTNSSSRGAGFSGHFGTLVTFTVGLWNIGIEGQINARRHLHPLGDATPPGFGVEPGIISANCGARRRSRGDALGSARGALRTFGGVNEIFGGLGLNFVATALNIWLIFGPWKRPGVASMSGTLPFDRSLWMPIAAGSSRLTPATLAIAVVGINRGITR